jgi:hypothetical protein
VGCSSLLQDPPQPARASDCRATLPAMASVRSSSSDTSGPTQDISRRLKLQQYEERLEALLESKLDDFREEVWALRSEDGANGGTCSASTDAVTLAAIDEVMSLFRTQLQRGAWTTATWTLEASLTPSWSDIVEQGHAEAWAMIQQDLDLILRRVEGLQSRRSMAETPRRCSRNTTLARATLLSAQ